MGIPLDEMVIWNPDLEQGGLTREQIEKAKIILWHGFCSVHQMFQPRDIIKFRNQYPDGIVISHPECSLRGLQAVGLRRQHRVHPADTVKAAHRTRAGWSAPSSIWSSAWRRK
jgi:quinolinate synthase